MDIKENYEQLKNEVAICRDELRSKIPEDSPEEELYKGTIILLSKLIYQPKFLFIGINPGAGFFNTTGIKYRDTELDPADGFEYILAERDGYDYTLAKQTRDIFLNTKYNKEFVDSVKTNFYYTATSTADDLKKFNQILVDKYHMFMWEKSMGWTKKLIDMIQPEIIICEGIEPLTQIARIYKASITREENIGSFYIDKVPVVGYKRNHSNILNKEKIIEFINKL